MAYIKLALALRSRLQDQLYSIFDKERVKIAPIKAASRCIAKAKEGPSSSPPKILDYLRATILCDSVEGTVSALEVIHRNFKVIRVKDRMLQDTYGNKAFLLFIVVRDPSIKPSMCTCFGVKDQWWPEGKEVKMLCEVQITISELFTCSKQAHIMYPNLL